MQKGKLNYLEGIRRIKRNTSIMLLNIYNGKDNNKNKTKEQTIKTSMFYSNKIVDRTIIK